jgi:uncharacterized membrane protein
MMNPFELFGTQTSYYVELLNEILIVIQRTLSFTGSVVIFTGALYAIYQFCRSLYQSKTGKGTFNFDRIRLDLGRAIILGLEFIIAADIIETTTMPDYYSLGILAGLVLVRTFLNFFLNRDLTELNRTENQDTGSQ